MQILKAIIDTQRTNNTIGYVNAGDAVKLNLQVISNGEIGDSWVNPIIELHGIKSDKKRVRQTDYIQVEDLESHQLEVELHEQMTTCDGLVRLQLVIKDGGRVSSSVFYLRVAGSLELDAIDSYDYIRAFDDFDTYMELVKEFEATMEEDILLLETELQKASDLSQSISNNEAKRQEAFETNESIREVQFNASQQTRAYRFNQDQNTRETQFNASQSSQTSTFTRNEAKRQEAFETNESIREVQFNASQSSQTSTFTTNEAKRQKGETQRVANENARQTAERNREVRMAELETKTSELIEKADEQVLKVDEQVLKVDEFINANTKRLLEEDARKDYMGNECRSIRETMNSNVDYAVKTAIGEFNYLDYEGQHITANNSIEGHVKSAILKGQTLVNHVTLNTKYTLNTSKSFAMEKITVDTQTPNEIKYTVVEQFSDWVYFGVKIDLNMLKPNTKYLVIGESMENIDYVRICRGDTTNNLEQNPFPHFDGRNYAILTTNDLANNTVNTIMLYLRCKTDLPVGSVVHVKNIMLIEYQEGMENWDIPYFTGMSSVRMPVLRTTGKNLFDGEMVQGYISDSSGNLNTGSTSGISSANFTPVKPNTTYRLSLSDNPANGTILFYFYDKYKKYVGRTTNPTTVFTTGNDVAYVKFRIYTTSGVFLSDYKTVQFQIEEGSVATSYEPHKSNILTVNELVELRGIGDVKDELNLLTGELTQRFGVAIFNETNATGFYVASSYQKEGHTTFMRTLPSNCVTNPKLMCEDVTALQFGGWGANIGECCFAGSGFVLRLESTKASNVEELKSYLTQNPLTVYYQLATPVVKTVVLSDNVVYSYDEVTHYDGSSESGSLIPTVAVKVPTDVNAVISSQRATIQEQTEQINTLEKENTLLTEQNEKQDVDIALNQDAINFMLFEVMGLSNDDANKLNPMAIYFANQILKGKLTYNQVIGKYPQFKDDIDSCLLAEGRSDLIVKID